MPSLPLAAGLGLTGALGRLFPASLSADEEQALSTSTATGPASAAVTSM